MYVYMRTGNFRESITHLTCAICNCCCRNNKSKITLATASRTQRLNCFAGPQKTRKAECDFEFHKTFNDQSWAHPWQKALSRTQPTNFPKISRRRVFSAHPLENNFCFSLRARREKIFPTHQSFESGFWISAKANTCTRGLLIIHLLGDAHFRTFYWVALSLARSRWPKIAADRVAGPELTISALNCA